MRTISQPDLAGHLRHTIVRAARRLRTRKTAYLARRLRDLDPDEVETLERAAAILERLLDQERGAG